MMNIHNRINYIEFTAEDLEAIKTFYSRVFGWEFTDYGPEYVAFTDGSLEGGFAKGNTPSVGKPLVILYSDVLEDTRRHIEENGGTTQPSYAFPGGKRFHFTDPGGNELAVWSL